MGPTAGVRKRRLTGDRDHHPCYADDFIAGFSARARGEGCSWPYLQERLRKFELALHPDKTRLIRFGRHAARECKASRVRGSPSLRLPRLHAFLHAIRKRTGLICIGRKTIKKRMVAKRSGVQGGIAQKNARFIACDRPVAQPCSSRGITTTSPYPAIAQAPMVVSFNEIRWLWLLVRLGGAVRSAFLNSGEIHPPLPCRFFPPI